MSPGHADGRIAGLDSHRGYRISRIVTYTLSEAGQHADILDFLAHACAGFVPTYPTQASVLQLP